MGAGRALDCGSWTNYPYITEKWIAGRLRWQALKVFEDPRHRRLRSGSELDVFVRVRPLAGDNGVFPR